MFLRITAVAVCVLLVAGCQQGGRAEMSPTALTGPSATPGSGVTGASAASTKPVDVPFAGSVTGEAAFDFATNPRGCASGFTTITTAKGQATHMGLTTWQSNHCVSGENTLAGDLVLTAANGDEVHVSYSGGCFGVPEIGDPFVCSGDGTVAGGTGRFEHATGTATWSAAITFEGFSDFSWPGKWEWKGTIRY